MDTWNRINFLIYLAIILATALGIIEPQPIRSLGIW